MKNIIYKVTQIYDDCHKVYYEFSTYREFKKFLDSFDMDKQKNFQLEIKKEIRYGN